MIRIYKNLSASYLPREYPNHCVQEIHFFIYINIYISREDYRYYIKWVLAYIYMHVLNFIIIVYSK